jgi:hypothetical protein
MSEGWGDFVALHMMLGPADDRRGSFGISLYALTAGGAGFSDPGYFGIRRMPYTTNRVKGVSFRHITDGVALPDVPINAALVGSANSEVHNAGEVWSAMLWDAYNAVLDRHDFADARRGCRTTSLTGLLLTPPDATFTGRARFAAAARSAPATARVCVRRPRRRHLPRRRRGPRRASPASSKSARGSPL